MKDKLTLEEIIKKHRTKLDNLKFNRSKAEEYGWSVSDVQECNAMITILADILSDLNNMKK